jgi:hypothetical protein
MQRTNNRKRAASVLSIVVSACLTAVLWSGDASAQVPIPTADTPTLYGGTPLNGMAAGGQIGYAAMRGAFFYGRGNWDVTIDAGIPTFGANDWLHGYNQSLGLDVRAPFRLRLAQWTKATGSLKVGPYFHVGSACGRGNDCDSRALGTGVLIGFVTDIALPKLFKLIVGMEQQFGLFNRNNRNVNAGDYTVFAGATWFDIGIEAFWRNIFFSVIVNVGAQYGSNNFHRNDHALYRQLFGVGYKFN